MPLNIKKVLTLPTGLFYFLTPSKFLMSIAIQNSI